MNTETLKAVEAGKLSRAQGTALDKLSAGTCVLHKSWGFGRITSLNFDLNQLIIDFTAKKGHPMQLSYAADSLTPLPDSHILARIDSDLPGVRSQAEKDPIAFVAEVLQSYSGKLTVDQLSKNLVPAVFKEPDFKKWWDSAKKALKKDGHFSIPSKKTDPIVYRSEAVSRSDEHLRAFSEARQLKDQINVLERILRDLEEFQDPLALQPVLASLEDSARKNAKLATPESITLLALRDELLDRCKKLSPSENPPAISAILIEEQRTLHSLLELIPAARLKRTISSLLEAFGEDWTGRALSLVEKGSTRLVSEAVRLLIDNDKKQDLHSTLDRSIRDQSISSAALVWLCDKKERKGEFKSLIQPRIFSAILAALDRDQFNENRDRKLHDLLVNDLDLLPDLIRGAEIEELRELTRKLLLTPVFEDLNKRSLLGRFVREKPELESLISGDKEEKQETLIVSWDSLEKRQAEYDELVSKKIPEIIKEISIAREHGDLRENFEYHAAKQQRAFMEARKAEMERDLSIARGTDFSNVDTSVVSVGTSVTIRETGSDQTQTYHILGAWDTAPERHIISYKAAMAQVMLGKKAGQQVNVPTEEGDRLVEIVSIAVWNKS